MKKGYKYSEEQKAIKYSDEVRQRMSEKAIAIGMKPPSRKGCPLSESTKKKKSDALKGIKLSAEHRLKISIANTGKRVSDGTIKRTIFHRKHSDETRKKMSAAKIGIVGEKCNRWKSDRSKLVVRDKRNTHKNRDWIKQIKKRDNWACLIGDANCSGRLEAHHIFGWKESPNLRYEIGNGISLCHAHHPKRREDERVLRNTFLELLNKRLWH